MSVLSDLSFAWRAERLKLKRTKAPLLTVLAAIALPSIVALFLAIMKHPEEAKSLGILGAKAQLAMAPFTAETYVQFGLQAWSMGSFFLFSLLVVVLFGRENVERTVKLVLATKTRRSSVVLAKFLVFAALSLVAFVVSWIVSLAFAVGLGVPGFTTDVVGAAFVRSIVVLALTWALMPITAWIASVGRGYLAAVSATLGFVFLSQILAVLGWGPWFPWALAFLYARIDVHVPIPFDAASYVESALAFVVGSFLVKRAWTHSERMR